MHASKWIEKLISQSVKIFFCDISLTYLSTNNFHGLEEPEILITRVNENGDKTIIASFDEDTVT